MHEEQTQPPRRTLWRRVVLIALETRAPWWRRAGLWVTVGSLLLMCGLLPWTLMVSTLRPVSYPFSYARQDDGSWKFNAQGPGPCLMFMTEGMYCAIPGAMRCDAWIGVYVKDGGAYPPEGLAVDDVRALRKKGSQEILDELAASGAPEAQQRTARAVLGMIIRGQKEDSGGVLLALRPYLIGLGVLLLIPGGLIGSLRQHLLRGYQERLALGVKGICPRCEHPMAGLSEEVCPECGLDVGRDMRESRQELGGPGRG